MNELSTLQPDGNRGARTDAAQKKPEAPPATPARQAGNELPEVRPTRSREVQSRVVESIDQAVAKLNDYVQSTQRDLRFSVDRASGRPIVRVIESSTDEVVRQIPSDVALRLARNLKSQEQISQATYAGGRSGGALGLVNTRI